MLTPWKESYDQPRQHIKKQRYISLPAKVCLVKAMVFPVVMCGCESWTIKKVEDRRIDAFVLWCWIRLLRVPWTARRSSQSILKEISPGCHWKDWCWSWNSNTLATWCEELAYLKRHWCWEGLKAGGEGDDRGWDGWMASPTRWAWVWVESGSWWWTGRPGMLWFMESQSQTRLSNWSELNWPKTEAITASAGLASWVCALWNCTGPHIKIIDLLIVSTFKIRDYTLAFCSEDLLIM